jgi:hypothetical protein
MRDEHGIAARAAQELDRLESDADATEALGVTDCDYDRADDTHDGERCPWCRLFAASQDYAGRLLENVDRELKAYERTTRKLPDITLGARAIQARHALGELCEPNQCPTQRERAEFEVELYRLANQQAIVDSIVAERVREARARKDARRIRAGMRPYRVRF